MRKALRGLIINIFKVFIIDGKNFKYQTNNLNRTNDALNNIEKNLGNDNKKISKDLKYLRKINDFNSYKELAKKDNNLKETYKNFLTLKINLMINNRDEIDMLQTKYHSKSIYGHPLFKLYHSLLSNFYSNQLNKLNNEINAARLIPPLKTASAI